MSQRDGCGVLGGRRHHGRLLAIAVLLTTVIVLPATASAARSAPRPDRDASVKQIKLAAQASTTRYWTTQKMAAATPLDSSHNAAVATQTPTFASGPPPGTSTAAPFDGVPTVGTFFFTDRKRNHSCSASVVKSPTRNIVLTAAHCAYTKKGGYKTNIVYVPGYHDGQRPYGTYAVKAITVAKGWKENADISLDFAFMAVAPDPETGRRVQDVTGGNRLGINLGYDHTIEAIGYPSKTDRPVQCTTRSFAAPIPSQLQFNCNPFPGGTSGGPLLSHYDPDSGSGIVIGVIGGYQEGGSFDWTSYSPYFDEQILKLFIHAETDQLVPEANLTQWWLRRRT
ncbi:MAG: trypsin-like serine peptidase [Mycobacteriales bacterium]